MKKNNKKKSSSVLALLLLVAMVGLVAVSGTYAKYTSELTGTSETKIAKWEWTVNDDNLYDLIYGTDAESKISVSLFDTIYDDYASTTEETDVDTDMIAPGTSGKFKLEIANLSEVNAYYTVELEETTNPGAKIQYSVDGGTTWVSGANLSTAAVTDKIANQEIAMKTGTATVTVMWKWVFEEGTASSTTGLFENDEADTLLGFSIAEGEKEPEVVIDAKLTLVQKD